jgi:succinate dehydrogenase hydrophobic anchor subunit
MLTHGLLVVGAVLLASAFLAGAVGPMRAAVVVLAAALAVFIVAVVVSFVQARSAHHTVRAMALAVTALAIAGLFGLYLAAGHGWNGIGLRRSLTDLHAGWGLVGWVGMLVIGVAYQVVPMFQMTPEYPRAAARGLAAAVFLSLALVSVSKTAGWPIPAAVGEALAGLGIAAFAVLTLDLQRRRRRRLPDVTLWFWRVAMASLLLAVACWGLGRVFPGWSGQAGYPLLLGVLMIVGFGVSVINGMLYKIVPFLVWLHLHMRFFRFGRLRGVIPNMKVVVPERRARRQFRVHMVALALLAGSTLWPEGFVYPAALAFGASCVLLWVNLFLGWRLFRRVAATPIDLDQPGEPSAMGS